MVVADISTKQIEYRFAILLTVNLEQFQELTKFGKIRYNLDEEVDNQFFRVGYLNFLITEKQLMDKLLERQSRI